MSAEKYCGPERRKNPSAELKCPYNGPNFREMSERMVRTETKVDDLKETFNGKVDDLRKAVDGIDSIVSGFYDALSALKGDVRVHSVKWAVLVAIIISSPGILVAVLTAAKLLKVGSVLGGTP